MGFGQYSPKQVIVTVGGVQIVGFAENAKVEWTQLEDAATGTAGCDGDVVRVLNANEMGEVTLHLLPQSPSNTYLSTLARQDRLFGTSVFEGTIDDLLTETVVHGRQGWIKKAPDGNKTNEVGEATWVLQFAKMEIFVGGSIDFT